VVEVYRLGGVTTLLIGVFGVIYSYLLDLGEPAIPGPGFWPFIASLGVLAASGVLLFTERSGEDYERFTGRARFIGYGAVSVAVFILLFQVLGFILPALLTFLFWLKFLGEESWAASVLLAVVFTAGFYVLFGQVLAVPFPDDVVAALWGGE
jgi:putative tricarboxylic transport membrane protein